MTLARLSFRHDAERSEELKRAPSMRAGGHRYTQRTDFHADDANEIKGPKSALAANAAPGLPSGERAEAAAAGVVSARQVYALGVGQPAASWRQSHRQFITTNNTAAVHVIGSPYSSAWASRTARTKNRGESSNIVA